MSVSILMSTLQPQALLVFSEVLYKGVLPHNTRCSRFYEFKKQTLVHLYQITNVLPTIYMKLFDFSVPLEPSVYRLTLMPPFQIDSHISELRYSSQPSASNSNTSAFLTLYIAIA